MQLLTATLLFPGAKSSSAISTQPKERTAKHWKHTHNTMKLLTSRTVKHASILQRDKWLFLVVFRVIFSQTSNGHWITLKREQTVAGLCSTQRRAAKHAGNKDRSRRVERPSICSHMSFFMSVCWGISQVFRAMPSLQGSYSHMWRHAYPQ